MDTEDNSVKEALEALTQSVRSALDVVDGMKQEMDFLRKNVIEPKKNEIALLEFSKEFPVEETAVEFYSNRYGKDLLSEAYRAICRCEKMLENGIDLGEQQQFVSEGKFSKKAFMDTLISFIKDEMNEPEHQDVFEGEEENPENTENKEVPEGEEAEEEGKNEEEPWYLKKYPKLKGE